MAESYHFITLTDAHRSTGDVHRGLNLTQVAAYEYSEHGADGGPIMTLIMSGGGKMEFTGEDARSIYRLIRGKW